MIFMEEPKHDTKGLALLWEHSLSLLSHSQINAHNRIIQAEEETADRPINGIKSDIDDATALRKCTPIECKWRAVVIAMMREEQRESKRLRRVRRNCCRWRMQKREI